MQEAPTVQDERKFHDALAMVNSARKKEAGDLLLHIVNNDLPDKNKALFLLGLMNNKEGNVEKAGAYLREAVSAYPLMRDYALKVLTDMYIKSGDHEKVAETSVQIENKLLIPYAMRSQADALLAMERKEEAKAVLLHYIEDNRRDWKYRFRLAKTLKEIREEEKAVQHFKHIYLNAEPLSEKSFYELKQLKAANLSREELRQRAGSLYKRNSYRLAEKIYGELLNGSAGDEREDIIYHKGMSQFRQKRYRDSAQTFDLVDSPRTLYWKARSHYRRSEKKQFDETRSEFEKIYPGHDRLGLLYLMDGDEFRRQRLFADAEANYKKALESFSQHEESALWGLAWLNYTSGKYADAARYLSELSSYRNSKKYYKYLFWEAKAREKVAEQCNELAVDPKSGNETNECAQLGIRPFDGLPSNESYYGYLIRLHSTSYDQPAQIEFSEPSKPYGLDYDRIEALLMFGLREEALAEIEKSLKSVETPGEFMYLGYLAIQLGEYRKVIAYAEPRNERELLPYSYPHGFWDDIQRAARARDMDAYLVAAIIREESRFNPKVVSWAGAVGLMQLMPSTAKILNREVKIHLVNRSHLQDPRKNILLGTHFLSKLIGDFKEFPFAVAAYNAGQNNLKKWMAKYNSQDIIEFIEHIPYRETRRYVKRVLKSYWQYRSVNGLPIQNDRFYMVDRTDMQQGVTLD